MKKFLSSVLLLIVFTLTTTTTAFAESTIKINGEQEAKTGDIVTYSVRITDLKDDIMAINAHVVYNQDYLSLISGGTEQEAFVFGSALSGVMYNEALQNRFLFNCANGTGYFPFEDDNLIIQLSFLVNDLDDVNEDVPLTFEFLEIYNTDSVTMKEGTDFNLEETIEFNVYEGSIELVDKTKESVNAEPSKSESPSNNQSNNSTQSSNSSSNLAIVIICAVIILFLVAIVIVLIIGKKHKDEIM